MNPGDYIKTAAGVPLRLGKILGKGGEGTIFHLENEPNLAVKIYTDGKQLERLPKLQAMIADNLCNRTSVTAFPLDVVYLNGKFIGFTMQKIVDSKPIFNLYTSTDRKKEFPYNTYRFLVRVALNYARAVASIHLLGAIIGDINESGALIDQRGLVKLIDSDSFQYESSGKVFPCLVGKTEYTPPELQGQTLSQLKRTPDHDAFGLAVILFEILFLGRHPFSGVPKGHDHPTIGEAIAAGRFAYSPHKSITNMEPPKHMPVLMDLPPNVSTAFQRAFGPNIGGRQQLRPTANEWVALLDAMEKSIVACKFNPAHYHSSSAFDCPWCRFEAGYRTILFVHRRITLPSNFNLEHAIIKINEVLPPGQAPSLASLLAVLPKPDPSKYAKNLKTKEFYRKIIGAAFAALFLVLISNGILISIALLFPAASLFFGRVKEIKNIEMQKNVAESKWKSANLQWENEAGSGKFNEKINRLKYLADSYRKLAGIEQEKLADLEQKKRDLQQQKHLDSHKIFSASIDGIGESRKLTLRSFGIETALDIEKEAIVLIPGFGPNLTDKLLNWKNTVARNFRFNPSAPTDQSEIDKIYNEISARRTNLETELLRGPKDLEAIKSEAILNQRNATKHQIAYLSLMEVKEDYKYLGLTYNP